MQAVPKAPPASTLPHLWTRDRWTARSHVATNKRSPGVAVAELVTLDHPIGQRGIADLLREFRQPLDRALGAHEQLLPFAHCVSSFLTLSRSGHRARPRAPGLRDFRGSAGTLRA